MDDLISRQAAIEVADAVWSVTGDKNVAKVWDQIRNLPSAEQRGRWIMNGCIEQCNLCGEPRRFPHWTTCPNCGARMEAE